LTARFEIDSIETRALGVFRKRLSGGIGGRMMRAESRHRQCGGCSAMNVSPLPWRCHRSLIVDALLARGIEVREIASAVRTRAHTLTPWARIKGTQVTYPALSAQASPPGTAR
jgi:hypothetical protein